MKKHGSSFPGSGPASCPLRRRYALRSPDGAFTLLEVTVALFILSLLLTAILRLELSSFILAARDTQVFESLVLGVERMDELIRVKFQGEEENVYDNYSISARIDKVTGGIPVNRLKVEIYDKDKQSVGDLSVYRIRTDAALSDFLQGAGQEQERNFLKSPPPGVQRDFFGSPQPGLQQDLLPSPGVDLQRELIERVNKR